MLSQVVHSDILRQICWPVNTLTLIAQDSTISKSQQAGAIGVGFRRKASLALALFGVLACFWGMWKSGREGLAFVFSSYGSMTNQLDAADKAVRLSPALPDAHYIRAGLLADKGELAEAIKEYEQAVALRPHDYVLWLELGRARDLANDVKGALAAFDQSVRLAPFYAKPRWQLGNMLYRQGRRDEAMAELRRAAISNPKLLPVAINLAWVAFDGDARAVEQAIQPQTSGMHLALARYFARRGKTSEAVAQFRAADNVSDDDRRTLLRELLAAKHFAEAYAVWSSMRRPKGDDDLQGIAAITNGGFEESITLDDLSFGWQLPRGMKAMQASQDTGQRHSGVQSLRLVWNGDSDPNSSVISQIVLVEPNARYHLRFAARTEELATVGLPLLMVADAGSNDGRLLGPTVVLPRGTIEWQDYTIEFTTGNATSAVLIGLRRQSCGPPCPIFGRVWLDDFSVQKM